MKITIDGVEYVGGEAAKREFVVYDAYAAQTFRKWRLEGMPYIEAPEGFKTKYLYPVKAGHEWFATTGGSLVEDLGGAYD